MVSTAPPAPMVTVSTVQLEKTVTDALRTRALKACSALLGGNDNPPTSLKNSAAMPPDGPPSVLPSPPDTIPPKCAVGFSMATPRVSPSCASVRAEATAATTPPAVPPYTTTANESGLPSVGHGSGGQGAPRDPPDVDGNKVAAVGSRVATTTVVIHATQSSTATAAATPRAPHRPSMPLGRNNIIGEKPMHDATRSRDRESRAVHVGCAQQLCAKMINQQELAPTQAQTLQLQLHVRELPFGQCVDWSLEVKVVCTGAAVACTYTIFRFRLQYRPHCARS